MLRTRLGFSGEIRAAGDFLYDQLAFMHRVGIDAFRGLRQDHAGAVPPRARARCALSISRAPTGRKRSAICERPARTYPLGHEVSADDFYCPKCGKVVGKALPANEPHDRAWGIEMFPGHGQSKTAFQYPKRTLAPFCDARGRSPGATGQGSVRYFRRSVTQDDVIVSFEHLLLQFTRKISGSKMRPALLLRACSRGR